MLKERAEFIQRPAVIEKVQKLRDYAYTDQEIVDELSKKYSAILNPLGGVFNRVDLYHIKTDFKDLKIDQPVTEAEKAKAKTEKYLSETCYLILGSDTTEAFDTAATVVIDPFGHIKANLVMFKSVMAVAVATFDDRTIEDIVESMTNLLTIYNKWAQGRSDDIQQMHELTNGFRAVYRRIITGHPSPASIQIFWDRHFGRGEPEETEE